MDDNKIVELYWQRSQSAIYETKCKYDRYCLSIASNILPSLEDAQECVNDTYLAAWNAIPPNRPRTLSTFLGKLTRRISIDRWRIISARKRGGGTIDAAVDELAECLPSDTCVEAQVEARELATLLDRFLESLPATERKVFLMRYFEMANLKDIQQRYGMSGSRVKSILYRTRCKLRAYLDKEGY